MAGITLAQAEEKLSLWLTAEASVASGQSITIDGNTVTFANLDQIQRNIEFWDRKVKNLSRGGIRVRGVTPL